MKRLAETYPGYEEANDAQITLLAAGIDCIVVRNTQGVWDIAEGKGESYGVQVDEQHLEQAQELLTRPIADNYDSLTKCPVCNSTNGKRYSYADSPWFLYHTQKDLIKWCCSCFVRIPFGDGAEMPCSGVVCPHRASARSGTRRLAARHLSLRHLIKAFCVWY
ncbi:hypothetical protein [Pelagicoccus mobilis]|uniref:DUF2007 domain-containing protein n=1 Tax=Pelagicoccus mobilis TaxID=415221 RepID=A0A934VQ77_9BACT|nr:hypothetical protein [Pelagicoccus mobilis]MBK1876214.1 hypothetical protein [Pelagicoccus mobilis]